jgi:hypothetical protein
LGYAGKMTIAPSALSALVTISGSTASMLTISSWIFSSSIPTSSLAHGRNDKARLGIGSNPLRNGPMIVTCQRGGHRGHARGRSGYRPPHEFAASASAGVRHSKRSTLHVAMSIGTARFFP